MPGTLSEVIFANTTGSVTDGKLTVTQSPISAGSGISVVGTELSKHAHILRRHGDSNSEDRGNPYHYLHDAHGSS